MFWEIIEINKRLSANDVIFVREKDSIGIFFHGGRRL